MRDGQRKIVYHTTEATTSLGHHRKHPPAITIYGSVCLSACGNWREGEMLGWWNHGPAIHEKVSKKTTILYFSSILFGWMRV
jgi:hypothetical protein